MKFSLEMIIVTDLLSAVQFVVRGKVLRVTQRSISARNNGHLGKKKHYNNTDIEWEIVTESSTKRTKQSIQGPVVQKWIYIGQE